YAMTIQEYNNCVRLYSDGVFRFVLKNIANRADAQDIVQNTFEKLWRKCDGVQYEKAKSYLYSIAHNDMIDQIRKRKFIQSYQQVPERAGGTFDKQLESKDIMEQSLAELSPTQRSLILLRDYEGYNYEEIAELTELSLSQVKVYLFRARKKMQVVINRLDKAV
ncbi:MAG: RNA polymerase sigma factor, partial [Bacteroidota bacterium]